MRIAVVLVPEHRANLVPADALVKSAPLVEIVKVLVADIVVLARGVEVCRRMAVASSATCQAAAS